MASKRRYVIDPAVKSSPLDDQQQHHPIATTATPPLPSTTPQQQAYSTGKQRIWAEDLEPPPNFQQPPQAQPSGIPPSASPQPPANHIPQPPHAAGPSLQAGGARPAIDPSQIPSPIEPAEMDQNLYDQEAYESCNTRGLTPFATTSYQGIDQGNSLPRYIRASLTQLPSSGSLASLAAVPMGLVVTPLAQPRYDEPPVPLVTTFVDSNSTSNPDNDDAAAHVGGPPRCGKCRGYVNPYTKFISGGSSFICNLCTATNPVPQDYMCHLDAQGVRTDLPTRPELLHGTVEFPVPRAYWATNPASLLDAQGLSTMSEDFMDALGNVVSTAASTAASHTGTMDALPVNVSSNTTSKASKRTVPSSSTSDHHARRPAPLGRVFMIDVSWSAIKSGMVAQVCEGIKRALYGPDPSELEQQPNGDETTTTKDEWKVPHGRVAIVTFDANVHFYNLSPELPRAHMMVVSDLDEPFVPLHHGFLVDPVASSSSIHQLLDSLPHMYAENASTGIALGAAVTGVLSGLGTRGGQLSIFLSSLPNLGPGALKPREDPMIYGTPSERKLFSPSDPFYRNTSEQLAEAGVGCNLFLFPERFIDVGSLGSFASTTGGSLFFHPRFDAVRDRGQVYQEIARVTASEHSNNGNNNNSNDEQVVAGYNATLRIRCSNGLRVNSYTGNFHQRSLTDIELANVDAYQSFGVNIQHDGSAKLDPRQSAFFQAALLYTTWDGQRRVRVMNLGLPVTDHIGSVYRFADLDTTVGLLLKEATTQAFNRPLADIRTFLTNRCVSILVAYRKHCASSSRPGQLVLPEVFKLLPLSVLGIIKSKAIKGGHVASDVRSLYLRTLQSLNLPAAVSFLYPRMFAVHNLPPHVGYAGPNGQLELPVYLRCSHAWMTADGAYILTNGEIAFLWLGSAVSPQILMDLYGVENLDEIDTRMTTLPKLPSYLSVQVRNILAHHERLLGHKLAVVIARQNLDGTEVEFANMLVEDANNDALSYTNYLMFVHKTITNEIQGGGKGSGWFS